MVGERDPAPIAYPIMVRTLAALALLLPAWPAWTQQSLIPTPYPGRIGGGQPLNPETPAGGPQELMRDPYPQNTGDASQGNPPITRTHRRQRPVPTINQRKYRVDRH